MSASSEMLIKKHKFVSGSASLAFMLFFMGLSAVVLEFAVYGERGDGFYAVPFFVPAMLLSLFSMISATIFVLRARAGLPGWLIFVVFTWFPPYFGISYILGLRNIIFILRSR